MERRPQAKSRKSPVPVLELNSMDYSRDFSDPIKGRSMSTSTPLATKSVSLCVYSPGNDSGYPDSIEESNLYGDSAALLDSTVTMQLVSTEHLMPEHSEKKALPNLGDVCETFDYETSDFNDWEILEEEDVFEKKHKRLSDFPRYSLEFESSDLDSSFGASALAEKMDSVAIHDVIQHFSPREPDRLIGRKIGLEKVDILLEMSARNIQCVSIVLSYLEPEDLCRIRHVSRRWKTICDTDSQATTKRKKYLKSVKSRASSLGKENRRNKSLAIRQNRGLTSGDVLKAVQRSTHVPRSPKKMQVANHAQAVSTLQFDEILRHCPKCNSASKILAVQDRGICMNEKCKFDFCIKCFCEHHGARNCVPVATKKSKLDSVGSKKCKKNLRRL